MRRLPTVTSTSASDFSRFSPRRSSAYTASAVAFVVFQSWVCFCLRSHTLQSSTAVWSFITSSNASIIMACVSIGARNQNCCNSRSRQNIPVSSFETDRSLIDAMMPRAAGRSLTRFSATARCAWLWRWASCSQ